MMSPRCAQAVFQPSTPEPENADDWWMWGRPTEMASVFEPKQPAIFQSAGILPFLLADQATMPYVCCSSFRPNDFGLAANSAPD
jgi:hypothetical protein